MVTGFNSIVEELKELNGFDGFVIFNEDCKPIEFSLPEEFLQDDTGYVVRDILSANIQALDDAENTVLLTEKGAWYVTKVGVKYFIILAGYNEVVDIPDLVKLGDKFKAEILK